jgi:hypothetical protein
MVFRKNSVNFIDHYSQINVQRREVAEFGESIVSSTRKRRAMDSHRIDATSTVIDNTTPIEFDALITDLHADTTQQKCTFFAAHAAARTEDEASFDWPAFWTHGAPAMVQLALELPTLFAQRTN